MDAAGVLPEALEFGLQNHFEFGQSVEDLIAETVLELIPQALNRVEFWTAGWKGDDAHIVGQAGVAVWQMKTSAILDQHRHRRRIALADLTVELPAMGLVHRFGEQELRATQAHAHRALEPVMHFAQAGVVKIKLYEQGTYGHQAGDGESTSGLSE